MYIYILIYNHIYIYVLYLYIYIKKQKKQFIACQTRNKWINKWAAIRSEEQINFSLQAAHTLEQERAQLLAATSWKPCDS